MQTETSYTLKQKLAKSRNSWLTRAKYSFLSTLYDILDNLKYQAIISWSHDGRVILIKNEKELASMVHILFEDSPTLVSFFRRLESCFFAEVYDDEYRGDAYEHLHFTREKRPDFIKYTKGKKARLGISLREESTIEVEQEREEKNKIKKIVKKELDEAVHPPLSAETRAEIARLNAIILKLQLDILLESMKKKTLQMTILGYRLEAVTNTDFI